MIKTLINRNELIPVVNPLESLEFNIFKEMDRMFDALFPDLTYNEVPDVFKGYPVSNVLINRQGEVKIEIAVTGFKKEDIDIYLEDNCLMVSAEKTSEKKENKNEEWKKPPEEFADLFLNWAHKTFAQNPAGTARYDWMENNMDSWVRVAIQ